MNSRGSSHCVLDSPFLFSSHDKLMWLHPCNKRPNNLQHCLKIIHKPLIESNQLYDHRGSAGTHKSREPVYKECVRGAGVISTRWHISKNLWKELSLVITSVSYPVFWSPQISLVRVHSLIREDTASEEILSYRIVAFLFSEDFLPYVACREDTVAVMNRLHTAWIVTDGQKRFCSSPDRPDRLCCLTSLLLSEYRARLTWGVKGLDVFYLPPSSPEVKNDWSYTSTS
jgi:hypothetical protein